jgi:outer membrane receptor protein involved in Fe transport
MHYPKTKHFVSLLFLLFGLLSKSLAQGNIQSSLKGAVRDTKNAAVAGATLILKDGRNGNVVKNGISNSDGSFSIETNAGNYVLSISYLNTLSYQSELIKVSGAVDLGVLTIETEAQNLLEVVIKSTVNKPLIQVEGRKLIYNIQNSTTQQGSNALEALRKTPGIIVNQDNTINLNGTSGALVMINGRQTYLQPEELAQLLRSMASSDLESIEIIKNPSAEYDAAGTGGIINLVLQKPVAEGFNGSINNGIAFGQTLKQNTNVNLNFRKGKVNAFGSYNHSFGYYAMDYDNDRITNGKIYLNANHDIDKRHSIGSTLGADYAIDSSHTIGIVLNSNFLPGPGLITPITNIYDEATGQLQQTLNSQSIYSKQSASRYNVNLNYRYKGANNTKLDVDADYGLFDSGTDNLSTNAFYSPTGALQSTNNFLVRNSRDIKLYAVKADYGFPLGKGRMAAGAKLSSVNAGNIFNQYDANGSVNIIDADLSNTFKYQEQISAGYLKYERPFSDALSLDLGLRLEHTHSEGNLQPLEGSSQTSSSVTRNYLDFFPTAGLTLKTKDAGTYTLSFARRIDRPAYNSLNPFSYPIDELSSWTGNPFLQPQYANTLSLQYSYKSTTISAGYTHTSDLSSPITEVIDTVRIMSIPRNIGFQDNFNLTLTQQLKLNAWWNLSITAIGYHLQKQVGTPEFGTYRPSLFSGSLNLQQTFKLPGEITAEAVGVFNSKRISGLNTYVRGNSQIDLGLQKNVFQNKATLRLAATDIFRTNRISSDTQLNGLRLHSTFRGESSQARLNFTYRFGNNKIKSKVDRESGLQSERERF